MEGFVMGPTFFTARTVVQAQTLHASKNSVASSEKVGHLREQRGIQQSRGRRVHCITLSAVGAAAVTSACCKRTGRARPKSPKSRPSTGQCERSAVASADAYHCSHNELQNPGVDIEPLIRIILAVFVLLCLCSAAFSGAKADMDSALGIFAGWSFLRHVIGKKR
eukprot:TRINITY_DN10882_c0_g1_i2.p1 TRINITY_DN10882_c0_g1~~TRINITY_DN10882_c0_g1_i2.p1  ORF type:complete len:181 (+),score=27.32 TRINITY_DN10882_c0_g1_i2:50-544(+)